MMTKKDYVTIAKIIKNNTVSTDKQFNDLSIVGDCLVNDLIEYFKVDNSLFDESRFRNACEKQ
jgi:hypothetical protein